MEHKIDMFVKIDELETEMKRCGSYDAVGSQITAVLVSICRDQEALITKLREDIDEVKDRVSAVEDKSGMI